MPHRLVVVAGAIGLSTACVSAWDVREPIDTSCEQFVWFQDADGDRWGNPDDMGTIACNPTGGFDARNDRDCADTDDQVGGRVGSICPDELVLNDPVGATDYSGIIIGQSEYVIVHADTDLVWAAAAEDACGPFGWGGHLATFDLEADLEEVLDLMGVQDVWAGYVGFRPQPGPNAATWGWRDGDDLDDGWMDDAGLTVGASGFCSPRVESYDDDLLYLALIRDRDPDDADASVDWCLGTPDEANASSPLPEDPPYVPRYGHFICERSLAAPEDFAIATP